MQERFLKLLRKGLFSWEDRRASRDDEIAEVVGRHVDAMADPSKLRRYCMVLGLANVIIWLVTILFPGQVRNAWIKVSGVNEKVPFTCIAIVFGIGLWLTYALLRLRFPDVEDQDLGSNVFGSVAYHANADRRFKVWLGAVIGGIANTLCLVILELARGLK